MQALFDHVMKASILKIDTFDSIIPFFLFDIDCLKFQKVFRHLIQHLTTEHLFGISWQSIMVRLYCWKTTVEIFPKIVWRPICLHRTGASSSEVA